MLNEAQKKTLESRKGKVTWDLASLQYKHDDILAAILAATGGK
jgi:hypothetical protein